MSHYAIVATGCQILILLFFLGKMLVRRNQKKTAVSEPPFPVWILGEVILAICILLVFADFGRYTDLIALFYALFALPLTAFLFFMTGRGTVRATENALLYLPENGKGTRIPYAELIAFSQSEENTLVLSRRIAYSDDGREVLWYGGKYQRITSVVSVLKEMGIPEIPFEKMKQEMEKELERLRRQEGLLSLKRRARASVVKNCGYLLTYLVAVIAAMLLYLDRPFVAAALFASALLVFLASGFLSTAMAKK